MSLTDLLPLIDVNRFDGAIFDLDGVVTKTARVHAQAWKQLFDDYLLNYARKTSSPFRAFDLTTDYRRFVDGKPRDDGVKSFLQSRGIQLPLGSPSDAPSQESICGLGNRKNALFLEALHTHGVEPFPATITCIQKLRGLQIKIAVVTASENCQEILGAAQISHLFDASVDGRDSHDLHLRGKPEPDTFLQAAKQLNVSQDRTVVFEDALAGVAAGHAGQFGIVVGLDRAQQAQELASHGAHVVVSDLERLALRDSGGILWRSAHVLPSALHTREIVTRLAGKRLVVFLDYDGTLTPIVERPELAVLSENMRAVLKDLSSSCFVGSISGRDRSVVQEFISLDTLIYAGSHGFDISGPPEAEVFHHEVGQPFITTLDHVETELQQRLQDVKGVLIERKKFSIAVHYRLVAEHLISAVFACVESVLSRHPGLRRSEGKKVVEVQPQIDWDKGRALLWLLKQLHFDSDDVLPLYIGDDLTDEDAFRVLENRGIGIVVEPEYRFSCAPYALADVDEVQAFLTQLHQALKDPLS